MPKPINVCQTYIRAEVTRVWEAITDPDFTRQYFFAQRFESTLEPGSAYRFVAPDGADSVVGEIEEVAAPHRLVMTWRILYDAEMAAEPPSRVEWELVDAGDGLTKVTTTHRDLALSPRTAASVGDGWIWIHGGLKSFVETGDGLPQRRTVEDAPLEGDDDRPEPDGADHLRHAVDANNTTWELLDGRALTPDEVDDLLGRAYAAMHHWRRAAGRGPANSARASWLVSRGHAVLGHGELALHHADRCLAAVEAAGLQDFDLAYAREARARALACLGRLDDAGLELAAARAVPIADDEDRKLVRSDLGSGPWYGLDAETRPPA